MQPRPSDTNKGKRLAYIVFSGVLLIAGFILVEVVPLLKTIACFSSAICQKGFVAVDNRYVVGQDTNARLRSSPYPRQPVRLHPGRPATALLPIQVGRASAL